MSGEEAEEREEVLAEVTDPDYLMGRDADGEADGDADGEGQGDFGGVVDDKGLDLAVGGERRNLGGIGGASGNGVKDEGAVARDAEMVDVMEV
jgi:hypothetical protein